LNSVIQQDGAAKKKAVASQSLNQKTAIRAVQVVAMFSFMAIFWTLWSSPTLGDWWNLIVKAIQAPVGEWMQLALSMLGLLFAAFVGFRIFEIPQVKTFIEPDEGKILSVFWGGLTLAIFALLTIPAVLNIFQPFTDKPVEHVFETRLNEQDDADMIRGYYEDLLISNQLASPLSDMQKKPSSWVNFSKSDAARATNDWRLYDLKPSTKSILKEATITTNSQGLRDKEYTTEIPEGTVRFGILGGSYVVGSGVNDNEVFETVCENKLNKEMPFNKKYELLNFAVPAYHLLHNVYQFSENIPNYDLDGLILISHGVDVARMRDCLYRNISSGFDIPFDFLQEIENQENLKRNDRSESDYVFQIEKAKKMVDACYRFIAEKSREKGMLPILVFWPRTILDEVEDHKDFLLETARKYNYVILDLESAYDGVDPKEIQLASWDKHPNKLGHYLVAMKLYEKLTSNPEIIELTKMK
ncbi:MAG: hypothetical protein KDC34_20590, partial [Saprospiraceae bacterium]|nr:hypothetical protein [Saprospiraceae bacterium]